MPTYITLYKWTDQGIRNVKAAPERIATATQATEAAGGKLLGVYVTMGEHDLVAISEWPSDEAAAAAVIGQAALGNVHTTTMRAFTPTEFAGIVSKIP